MRARTAPCKPCIAEPRLFRRLFQHCFWFLGTQDSLSVGGEAGRGLWREKVEGYEGWKKGRNKDGKKRGNEKIEAVTVLGREEAVGPRGEGPREAASQESPVYTGGSQTA